MAMEILTANQVTEDVLKQFYEVVDGWYQDERIDWDDVFRRVEQWGDYDFSDQWDNPAIRKIQRKVREWRRDT